MPRFMLRPTEEKILITSKLPVENRAGGTNIRSNPRRSAKMRNCLTGVAMVVAAALTFSSLANAQGGYRHTEYEKLNNGPGGPAPKRDFTGTWAGPIAAQNGEAPSFTPEGQKLFSMNKPEAKFHVAGTNDGFV